MKLWMIRLALSSLDSENGRRSAGFLLIAVFSPLILLIAFLCALASGEAEHNINTVEACFYGAELSEETPEELRRHIQEMQDAFTLLDSAVTSANTQMEDGGSLDPISHLEYDGETGLYYQAQVTIWVGNDGDGDSRIIYTPILKT